MDLLALLKKAQEGTSSSSNQERVCQWYRCRKKFKAKRADVNRGWAKFCSKRCKALEQENRTGQNASYLKKCNKSLRYRDSLMNSNATSPFDSDGNDIFGPECEVHKFCQRSCEEIQFNPTMSNDFADEDN